MQVNTNFRYANVTVHVPLQCLTEQISFKSVLASE